MASTGTAPGRTNPTQIPNNLLANARVINGAKWFYWIAALSVVNSLVMLFGGQLHFVVGLGISSVVDAMAKQAGSAGAVLDIVINGFVAGIFVLFGTFARKQQKWAFMIGMALYALDGLLLLAAGDILSVAFHGYALYAIYRGLAAVNQLQNVAPSAMMAGGAIEPR